MDIYITDKKAFWELTYWDDDRDIVFDMVYNHCNEAGFTFNKEADRWETDSDNYKRWETVFANMRASEDLIYQLNVMGVDWKQAIDDEIGLDNDMDVDVYEAAKRSILEDTFEKAIAQRIDSII